MRAPRSRVGLLAVGRAAAAPSPPSAKTFTSVSTIIDLVTGFTQEAIELQPLGLLAHLFAAERRDQHDRRRMLQRLVALDVAAGLQAVHARHPPVHEDDVVRLGRRRAA